MITKDEASQPLARLGELLSRQDIFDCIKRVSRAIDRFDEELFVSGFHEDAVIDAGAFVGTPRKVYAGGRELHDVGQVSTLHHLTNHTCDIDDDVAHAETYFFFVGLNRTGGNWMAGGRYADRLERREGLWKIAFRCTLLEWSGLVAESQVPLFADVPDLGLNGLSSRGDNDPSYRRPLINHRAVQFPDAPSELSMPRS